MRTLLITKAAVELLAGLAFALFPSLSIDFLLGAQLDAPAGLYAFRMFAVAILAMGFGCWLVRNDTGSVAVRGLIIALLFYDLAFVAILLAARFVAGLSGIGLWPTVVVHLCLAGFSALRLGKKPAVVRAG